MGTSLFLEGRGRGRGNGGRGLRFLRVHSRAWLGTFYDEDKMQTISSKKGSEVSFEDPKTSLSGSLQRTAHNHEGMGRDLLRLPHYKAT